METEHCSFAIKEENTIRFCSNNDHDMEGRICAECWKWFCPEHNGHIRKNRCYECQGSEYIEDDNVNDPY